MRLEMVADIVEAFVTEADGKRCSRLPGEIRRLETPFGAAVSDHTHPRWRLAAPAPPEPWAG